MANANLQTIAAGIADGIQNFANHSAKAAATANGVSAGAQAAQGAFNAAQAATANNIGTDRIADQMAFNSAQANAANEFTKMMWENSAAYNSEAWDKAAAWNEMMWDKTAAWNEKMAERQMQFNANEALKQRQWQQNMAETSYQRAMTDMQKAGLNPILAAGGISTSAGGGSAASVGLSNMGYGNMSGPNMGAMSGQAASSGLMNGIAASEGNYTGQMEYMGGMLGLLSAAIGGIHAAIQYAGDGGPSIAETLKDMLGQMTKENYKNPNTMYNNAKRAAGRTKDALKYYIDRGIHPNKYVNE